MWYWEQLQSTWQYYLLKDNRMDWYLCSGLLGKHMPINYEHYIIYTIQYDDPKGWTMQW